MHATPQTHETRHDVLRRAIDDIQFGALVLSVDEDFNASHLPMLACDGPDGTLVLEGHVSRANDIANIAGSTRGLAIFQGPQAYIHPGWYPTKKQTGRVVPTWNYMAVYTRGTVDLVEDESWLRRHVEALTVKNEASRDEPWAVSDAPSEFIDTMVKGIVGLKLRVAQIDGVWKMGQKHPLENRLGAASGLAGSVNTGDRDLGAVMKKLATRAGV